MAAQYNYKIEDKVVKKPLQIIGYQNIARVVIVIYLRAETRIFFKRKEERKEAGKNR